MYTVQAVVVWRPVRGLEAEVALVRVIGRSDIVGVADHRVVVSGGLYGTRKVPRVGSFSRT